MATAMASRIPKIEIHHAPEKPSPSRLGFSIFIPIKCRRATRPVGALHDVIDQPGHIRHAVEHTAGRMFTDWGGGNYPAHLRQPATVAVRVKLLGIDQPASLLGIIHHLGKLWQRIPVTPL